MLQPTALPLLLLIFGASAATFAARVPPRAIRGYDSYDGFPIWNGDYLSEVGLLRQAALLAQQVNATHSERETDDVYYVVIDEGWADVRGPEGTKTATRRKRHPGRSTGGKETSDSLLTVSGDRPRRSLNAFTWYLDDYGRPIPNPQLFPSAINSTVGFQPLVSKLKLIDPRFELGVWMLKGITQQAVDDKLPILGTNYTAADIALTSMPCVWHTDVFAVNVSHPAGQVFFDSVMSLYASWGISYVKVDCIFGVGNYDLNNIAAVSLAVTRANEEHRSGATVPPMLLSLSPGVLTSNEMANSLRDTAANAYRVTGDLWDCWSTTLPACPTGRVSVWWSTLQLANLREQVNEHGVLDSAQHPDVDMVAVGTIRLGTNHTSTFSFSNIRYIVALWSIVRSPIILSGDLSGLSPWLTPDQLSMILGNKHLLALHVDSIATKLASFQVESNSSLAVKSVWTALHVARQGVAFGVYLYHAGYNSSSEGSETEGVWLNADWNALGISFVPVLRVVDLFTGRVIARSVSTSGPSFSVWTPVNDAVALRFEPDV